MSIYLSSWMSLLQKKRSPSKIRKKVLWNVLDTITEHNSHTAQANRHVKIFFGQKKSRKCLLLIHFFVHPLLSQKQKKSESREIDQWVKQKKRKKKDREILRFRVHLVRSIIVYVCVSGSWFFFRQCFFLAKFIMTCKRVIMDWEIWKARREVWIQALMARGQ